MSGDSQASFSSSIEAKIRSKYGNHCAICLNYLPDVSTQSAHLIDSASEGARQLDLAAGLGILSADYRRSSPINGMAQCAGCHIGFFTPNLIALSPALPVLKYILHYIEHTPAANRKPLHEAMTGTHVTLPDLSSISPYLELFTLVILKPDDVLGRCISTQHLPPLSILRNNRFEAAPNGAPSAGENVARIFDVLATAADCPPNSYGIIPLSPEDPEFQQRRYWRLPVGIGAVFAALIARTGLNRYQDEEITYVQHIAAILFLEMSRPSALGSRGNVGPGGGGAGPGGSSARSSGSGAGPSGGTGGQHGRSGEKRSLRTSDRKEPDSKRGRKKAVKPRLVESGGSELSDRSASPERIHHGVHPLDWEVASSFSDIVDDESIRTRSIRGDSEGMPSKAASEEGPDDPNTWEFGPSYRSDMIIVAARGICLF